ncbi:conserved Plasmodium protein, unknown function [Plasmodium vinckei lentum]|uniref:Uncharacterized protein n=1 Tax=Plasmodium vinckei lentum TaxID=138297 RepID=A0A6V7S145_PLAVN|nr:conserved Plasmodium protein, unknown function [Plasmodium vinckei lentum]
MYLTTHDSIITCSFMDKHTEFLTTSNRNSCVAAIGATEVIESIALFVAIVIIALAILEAIIEIAAQITAIVFVGIEYIKRETSDKMKEFENFDIIKKKFTPLLYIFKREEENELKRNLKRKPLLQLINSYRNNTQNGRLANPNTTSFIFMKNRSLDSLQKPFFIFNKYYHNNIFHRRRFFSTFETGQNVEYLYNGNNDALNTSILTSRYRNTYINNNVIRPLNDDEVGIEEYADEYVIVNKVYTFINEESDVYMYIY